MDAGVPEGSGGAVAVQSKALMTLINVAVTANEAPVDGGGIASEGGVEIFQSLIAGNTARTGHGGGYAALGRDDTAYVHVTASTISANTALEGAGAGLYATANTSLLYSTVAENQGKSGGRGLHLADVSQLYLNSTLFARNSPQSCSGVTQTNTGHNLVDDASCALKGPGDLQVADARLGPLTDNGGPTNTHALLPGSPAIDQADLEPGCGPDQRGSYRLDDQRCDIGAYETSSEALEPTGHIAGQPLDVYADGLGGAPDPPQRRAAGPVRHRTGVPGLGRAGIRLRRRLLPGRRRGQGRAAWPAHPDQRSDAVDHGRRHPRARVALFRRPVARRHRDRDLPGSRARRAPALRDPQHLGQGAQPPGGPTATLRMGGTVVGGEGMLGLKAADGSQVRIHSEAGSWNKLQAGLAGFESDVHSAFAAGGLTGAVDGNKDQLGVQYDITALEPGETRMIELRWEVDLATQTVPVTTTADSEPGEKCTPEQCTLRAALQDAPANSVIRLPAGVYTLEHGALQVSSDRIVRGAGADATEIRQTGAARVLTVSTGSLGLSGVRVTGGRLVVQDDHGGGIRVGPEARLALSESRVDHNTANGEGGGIYTQGPTFITRSTIDTNTSAKGSELGGRGGGLRTESDLSLVNVTISGNTAELRGGGLRRPRRLSRQRDGDRQPGAAVRGLLPRDPGPEARRGGPAVLRPRHDRRDRCRQRRARPSAAAKGSSARRKAWPATRAARSRSRRPTPGSRSSTATACTG